MKLSNYLLKTYKEISSEEKSINAQYLIRWWFVDQLMAGAYTLLPLGLRVMKKIENIVRAQMNMAGANEIYMPALQPKANWVTTDRWDNMDNLFKFTSFYSKIEYALGPTHEEVVTPLIKKFIWSYQDLPLAVYQFQSKFRDEKRAKSWLLRGREFLMKDCYSFHTSAEDLDRYYEIQKQAYINIFDKMWIADRTFLTYASGWTFSKFSHEFQTVCAAWEDTIYLDETTNIAFNDEIINDPEVRVEFDLDAKQLKELKTIEVGNIFKLNTKFSQPFDVVYTNSQGEKNHVYMGCYGIGIGRLMGTVVEAYHDEKGICWPEALAPFTYIIIPIGEKATQKAQEIYDHLLHWVEVGSESDQVMLDDRAISPWMKLKDADLIGYAYQIIVSDKTLAEGENMVEVVKRATGESNLVDYTAL